MLGNALLMQRKDENLLDTLREAGPGADQRYEILLLRARAQLELGRLREAGAAFDAARLAAPTRTEPLVGLALVAPADGRADDAMRHVDSALSLDAKDTEAWYQKVEIARARREPAKALDAWGQTLVLNPNHMRARIARAGVLSAQGQFEPALADAEYVLGRNPNDIQAAFLAGQCHVALARRDPRGAVDWLGKAVAIAPRDTATRVRLVELQLGLGDKPAALKTAEALASSLPENPDALELLGRAQAATGDRERAQRSFREAVRYAGFNLPALMRIARHQVGQLDFDAARKTLIKAAQANGDTSAAQAALVRLDLRTRRFDAARERAAQLVEDPRTVVMGRVLLGETALAERDPTAAITHFEEALNEQANPVAMLGLFDALNAAGKPADALSRLEAWTVAHPDDREARRKLALWYVPNGRLADAQKMLEALIVDEPRDPVLLSTLARIYQLDKDGRALDLASRAVEAQPDWAPGLETLGWILVTQGDIPKGLDYLRQSIAREENPLTRMHIAQALKESGRIAEARAELQVLLATHPTLPWKADVDALNASLGSTPQTP